MRVQFDNTTRTCIYLHVYYEDEQQVLCNGGFVRDNFAGTGIRTRDPLTRVFFIAAVTFLTGFSASSCVPDTVGPLLWGT